MAAPIIWFERRPCLVLGNKAMFHMWVEVREIVPPSILKHGHQGGIIAGVLGLVEYENGSMAKMQPEHIQFVDGGDFHEWCWAFPGKEEKEKNNAENS